VSHCNISLVDHDLSIIGVREVQELWIYQTDKLLSIMNHLTFNNAGNQQYIA